MGLLIFTLKEINLLRLHNEFMKRFLLPLIAALACPLSVKAGIPESRNVWMEIDLKPGIWRVDTSNAKARGSSVIVGTSRQQEKDENADGYWVMSWTGTTKVNCKTFKQTIKVPGQLFGGTSKIEPNHIGYVLADNLCYLTGVEGYTPNPNPPEWVVNTVKTIKSKPIKQESYVTSPMDMD